MTLQQKLDLLPQRFLISRAKEWYFLYLSTEHQKETKPISIRETLEGAINDAIKKRLKQGAYPKMSPLTKEWLLSQL